MYEKEDDLDKGYTYLTYYIFYNFKRQNLYFEILFFFLLTLIVKEE